MLAVHNGPGPSPIDYTYSIYIPWNRKLTNASLAILLYSRYRCIEQGPWCPDGPDYLIISCSGVPALQYTGYCCITCNSLHLMFPHRSHFSAVPHYRSWSESNRYRTKLPPDTCLQIFIVHRVQHSHCSSIFIKCCLLTHALALSANQFFTECKKKSLYSYSSTSMCTR